MIYLFSSASRPIYQKDVLEVLARPTGATITHRYRMKGERRHVHPDLVKRLFEKSWSVRKRIWRKRDGLSRWLSIPPEAVLLVYVDKWGSSDATYHPLRLASLEDAWTVDDRAYFELRLGDFVASSAAKVQECSKEIERLLDGKNPPRRVNDDPNNPDDGFYALEGPSFLEDAKLADLAPLRANEAWLARVNALAGTERFKRTPIRATVFVRTELVEVKQQRRTRQAASRVLTEWPKLERNKLHELRIVYRCPGYEVNEEPVARAQVQTDETLRLIDEGAFQIDGETDERIVPIVTKRYTEEQFGFVYIEITPASTDKVHAILAPKALMQLKVREQRGYVVKIVVLSVFFAVGSVVAAASTADITATLEGSVLAWTTGFALVYKSFGAIVQFGAVFLLVRLHGKKPV